MSAPTRFLIGFAQAMSAMNLYKESHPARNKALDRAHEALQALQEDFPTARFSFIGTEVVLNDRPLHDFRHWDWAPRLSAAGVQRLELLGPVTREELDAFLREVYARVTDAPAGVGGAEEKGSSNIRYGELALKGDEEAEEEATPVATANLAYSLQEEMEGVEWLHAELQDGREIKMLEAEGIIRSLSVAMHGDQAFFIPLVRMKEHDQYTVAHAFNVSVLAMAMAEFLGLSPREVRAFGVAGLLHDVGKVKVPKEILNKPGPLTDEERTVLETHPVEGARMILSTEEHLDLAAVVAYEHHIRADGGGYPALRHPRACHRASDLVHVCDAFDALRTERPYRAAWSTERALDHIRGGAGTEFDAELARAFLGMMRKWHGGLTELSPDSPHLPAEGGAPVAR